MNPERLKMLEEFALQEPADPFNLYALALEYLEIDATRADQLFTELLGKHPDYVPTYYHAGNFYWERGDSAKALAILEKGLRSATSANDIKARNEIRALLDAYEE